MVKPLIERMDRWLRANRPDYYRHLRRGATDAQLNSIEKKFSIKLPAAFRELYRWRNGQESRCFSSLHYNRMFTPLADIDLIKEMFDGMIGNDFMYRVGGAEDGYHSYPTAAAVICALTWPPKMGRSVNSSHSGKPMPTGPSNTQA